MKNNIFWLRIKNGYFFPILFILSLIIPTTVLTNRLVNEILVVPQSFSHSVLFNSDEVYDVYVIYTIIYYSTDNEVGAIETDLLYYINQVKKPIIYKSNPSEFFEDNVTKYESNITEIINEYMLGVDIHNIRISISTEHKDNKSF